MRDFDVGVKVTEGIDWISVFVGLRGLGLSDGFSESRKAFRRLENSLNPRWISADPEQPWWSPEYTLCRVVQAACFHPRHRFYIFHGMNDEKK